MADRGCKRRKQANPRRKNGKNNLISFDYLTRNIKVDLEHMPEDADSDQPVGMRPSLSPPPLNAPIPSKGSLLPSEEGSLANGSSSPRDRPARINGAPAKKSPEDEKIQEYLKRSDTAVIFPEPVGGASPKQRDEKPNLTPEPTPVIEEPKVPREYLLKCTHCEQVFSGLEAIRELKEHLSHAHKEAGPPESNYTCQKCNASFASKENLAKHKLMHVTNGQNSALSSDENDALRKFKCTECGKGFKFKHHLKEHIRIHSGEKPFACGNCGKRFSHSGSFSSHNTGKKCFVVNLKVRKVDSRSPRGRGTTQNNSFRPIIPKHISSGASPSDMPLIPAGYMPSSERFSNFSTRPPQPFMPLAFHPLTAYPPHLPLGPFPEVTQLLHQRRYENDSDHHALSQPPLHLVPSSSNMLAKSENSPAGSPQTPGELNEVKKVLEIVDATVTKQQKSPTRSRNNLLCELLNATPHSMMKSPQPIGASIDARCRFCSKHFDSKVDLHQHERYICTQNVELRTKGSSPQMALENGNDGESCEENRTCVSPSSLNINCLTVLRNYYQMNSRPKKSETIRLARDLRCNARTIQEWFHRQQMRSKDYPVNGNLSRSPPSPHQHSMGLPFSSAVVSPCNGSPFQSAILPNYNGAISSCNQIIPFRPIAERSPRLEVPSQEDEQPLDLSVKVRPEGVGHLLDQDNETPSSPPLNHCDSEALNLSQRSSRTPPKVSSPYPVHNSRSTLQQMREDSVRDMMSQNNNNNVHSSLLYKYMQMGVSNHRPSSQREKSPVTVMPSSPDKSPSHTEQQHSIPSPGEASYVDNSNSPSGTTGSYCHTDEPGDGIPFSPSAGKKRKLWNQGEGDESTLEDILGVEEDSSGGSGKMRKSWKLHKVESEEGMYACDQCDKMFSKQSSLARHKYEHSGQRPHKCEECGKAFKHKHHLTEHKRLHSGEKPFQCKKCLKRFSHSGSYSQHMNHRYNYCKPYHE